MKTAVSIPDRVFREADRLAKKKKVTRSELYARALEALLKAERDREITAKLNEVYKDENTSLDRDLVRAAARILAKEEW